MNRLLALTLGLGLTCTGCTSGDEPRALPPVGTAGSPSGGTSDAGPGNGQDDAGRDDEDAGNTVLRRNECDRVNPTAAADEDIPQESRPSGVTEPGDFKVTRALTTWAGDCTDPHILIELSDGRCPDGKGHALQIYISTDAITEKRVTRGENIVSTDADMRGIRVRYTRPEGLEPAGLWGTCSGASGALMLPQPLDLSARSMLLGTYQLTLTDCGEGSVLEPIAVRGSFNVELYRGLDDYCVPDPMSK